MRSPLPLLLVTLGVAAPVTLAFRAPTPQPQDPEPEVQDPAPVPTVQEAQALMQAGKFAEAVEAFGALRAAQPDNGQAVFLHAYCLHMCGRLEEAHQAHVDATVFPQFAALAHYNHACIHSLWEQPDPAFAALERAVEAGFGDVGQLTGDSDLENLHGDARWSALVARLRGEAAATDAAAPAPPEPFSIAAQPKTELFGFLVGEWDMTPEGMDQPWGVVRAEAAFDGTGVATTLVQNESGKEASRATLVLAEDGTWTMVWVDPRGRHAVFKGDRDGDRIVLDQQHADWTDTEGRIVWHDIGRNSFRYTLSERSDPEEPYTTSYELVYTRR